MSKEANLDQELKYLIEQLVKTLGILDKELVSTVVDHVSLVLGEECPTPNKQAIRRSLDGLALKFRIHGFPGLAQDLEAGVQGLVRDSESSTSSGSDEPWNLMKLLLALSWQPMARAQQEAVGAVVPPEPPIDDTCKADSIDWTEYLLEGGWELCEGEEDSDGDWSQLSDNKDDESSKRLPTEPLMLDCPQDTVANPSSWALRAKHVRAQIQLTTPTSHAALPVQAFSVDSTGRDMFKYSDPFACLTTLMELAPLPSSDACSLQRKQATLPARDEEAVPPAHSTSQMEILSCYRAGFEAKCRLNSAVQNCEWFSVNHATAHPGKPTTPVPADRVTVLTEYQVMREVLWMFLSSASMHCFGLDEGGLFQPRPDFTVRDVTADTLWHYLHPLCPHYDSLRQLQLFLDDLYALKDGLSPPGTYREYGSALRLHLAAFKRQIAGIHARVAKQESVSTLISVARELQPILDQLGFLSEIHRRATWSWREKPYWLSSVRLLSVLYAMLLQEWVPSRSAILLDLLVRSFHTYMLVMDTVLTQGRLVDPLGEFIVYSDSNVDSSLYESWDNGFYMQPYAEYLLRDSGDVPFAMLDNVASEILVCCKTMHLLHKMEKMCYLQRDHEQDQSMYQAFLKALQAEFAKFVTPEELIPLPEPEKEEVLEPALQWTGKANLMASHLTNPFLREVFREFVEFEDNQQMSPRSEQWRTLADDDCKILKRYAGSTLLPYEAVLCGVLKGLVGAKCSALGVALSRVMSSDVRLAGHLRTLRAVYTLEMGDIGGMFIHTLMQKVKEEPYWQYSHYLTDHLEEYFSKIFPGMNRFHVTVEEKFLQDNILDAVDGISLNYMVEWPLSLILSHYNRRLYNEVFRQLLKQKLALSTLERLSYADLAPPDPKQRRRRSVKGRVARWQLLRFYTMNALSAVHNFTMSHVVHILSARFDLEMRDADDFDFVVEAHNRFVRRVHRMCLNPFSDERLQAFLSGLLQLSQTVAEFWSQGSFVLLDDKLAVLEQSYCALHTGICDSLLDFNPKETSIQVESLLSVFSYPLTERYQNIHCHSGGV